MVGYSPHSVVSHGVESIKFAHEMAFVHEDSCIYDTTYLITNHICRTRIISVQSKSIDLCGWSVLYGLTVQPDPYPLDDIHDRIYNNTCMYNMYNKYNRAAPPSPRNKKKMDRVLNECSLERKDLDFKCTRKIILRIAGKIISEWYLVGRELDVAEEKLTSIRNDGSHSPEEKAVAMLDAWADEYGKGATCLKLATALYQRNKRSVIEILCEEVAQMSSDTTTSGAGAAVSPQPSDYRQEQHGKTT